MEAAPWPVVRHGRAGRGPGPDIREAAFIRGGVPICGDVEVHLRASDFERHGHLEDPAYSNVVLHLVWEDDRPASGRGAPQALAGGGHAPTVAVGPLLEGQARRVRTLVARGPAMGTPCERTAREQPRATLVALVRREGQRRLAERAWRAGALAVERGWTAAWIELADRALVRSAGRHAESPSQRAALIEAISTAVGQPVERGLARHTSSPEDLISLLRAGGSLGQARAGEVGWNAALPLLIALATAYADIALARATAALARDWPAPRPYGRSRALHEALAPHNEGARAAGALWTQGLLHLQDLWCSRGGCGACPLSGAGVLP